MDHARAALHDAKVLFEGGGTDAGVLNRLYYAAFHSAQAVLYVRGENPSSHGDATREEGRLLGTLYDYRQAADYGGEVTVTDLGSLVRDVEAFLEHMEELVEAAETEN